MSTKKKILIAIVAVISILVILKLITNKTPEEQIGTHLIKQGFVQEEGSTMYHKLISPIGLNEYNKAVSNNQTAQYEMLYFNTSSYKLTKDKMSYHDNIQKSFNPTYDYVNDTLTYTYRINLESTNIIVKGDYNTDTKEFTCVPNFSYQVYIETTIDDICASAQYDVEQFSEESLTLITSNHLLSKIKNNH